MPQIIRTLCENDQEAVFQLSRKQFESSWDGHPMKMEMATWTAPWRNEALEFYLPKSWSFGLWDKETDELKAFFLGQVLVHHRGLTQTLWVEYALVQEPSLWSELLDVAVRLAKSKHLQAVIFYKAKIYKQELEIYKTREIEEDSFIISTCKTPVEDLF